MKYSREIRADITSVVGIARAICSKEEGIEGYAEVMRCHRYSDVSSRMKIRRCKFQVPDGRRASDAISRTATRIRSVACIFDRTCNLLAARLLLVRRAKCHGAIARDCSVIYTEVKDLFIAEYLQHDV